MPKRYIEATEAIRVLSEYYHQTDLQKYVLAEAISAVPTADVVERKKGKWIIKDNPGTGWYRVTCSECGEDVTSVIPVIGFFPNAKPNWDFCPECGSYNGEESDNE